MEFDIKELTITLMVGTFTILGFEAILYYFFGKGLIGFFKRGTRENTPGDKGHPLTTIVMFVVFAFGLGIIAENLSLKYVDSDEFPFKKIPAMYVLNADWIQNLGFPSEEDDRVRSLLGNLENQVPDRVAMDLAANHAFQISEARGLPENERSAKTFENWILSDSPRCTPKRDAKEQGSCLTKDQVVASAKSLYYYAKNTVYSHPQSYDELKRIEDRLQFVRSVSFVAFLYSIAAALLVMAKIVVALIKKATRKRITTLRRPGKSPGWYTALNWILPWGKPMAVTVVMLAIYFFSLWAYGRESDYFNRRAFGYFSTMLISEERERANKADESLRPTFGFAGTPR